MSEKPRIRPEDLPPMTTAEIIPDPWDDRVMPAPGTPEHAAEIERRLLYEGHVMLRYTVPKG